MTTVPTRTVRLCKPVDFIAMAAYLLGFHPERSIVVMAFDSGTSGPDANSAGLGVVVRFDLPEDANDGPDLAGRLTEMLKRNDATHVILIGYGSGQEVTPTMDAVRLAVAAAGVPTADVLRVHDGRYWSYVCPDPGCCAPEGTPYDVAGTETAAEAVLAGFAVARDRGAFAQRLASVTGPEREAVQEATRTARSRAQTLLDTGHDWYQEGLERLTTALDRAQVGEQLTDDEVAWLGVLLTGIAVRDAALTMIGPYSHETHIRLWSEVVRQVEPGYVAAPAAVLAFVALLSGDGALSRVAVDRALTDDPSYRFANMIAFTLDHGIPPEQIAEVDWAGLADEIAANAKRYPLTAQPTLPSGGDQ
ncbi:DUF4192 domain-containing protein [Microbispora sp. NPDC049125]|uniref:DUF4192 domain-containing protein n=1 Tax=Microbispora sp. NPDC049125 TaxID=3154929 RepID=UPI003466353D